MTLAIERLERDEHGQYPEPEGELLDVLDVRRGVIRAVTRCDEVATELLLDPAEYTVTELEDALADIDVTETEKELLHEAESGGKDRATAFDVIAEQ